jgi:hypothetical protein
MRPVVIVLVLKFKFMPQSGGEESGGYGELFPLSSQRLWIFVLTPAYGVGAVRELPETAPPAGIERRAIPESPLHQPTPQSRMGERAADLRVPQLFRNLTDWIMCVHKQRDRNG